MLVWNYLLPKFGMQITKNISFSFWLVVKREVMGIHHLNIMHKILMPFSIMIYKQTTFEKRYSVNGMQMRSVMGFSHLRHIGKLQYSQRESKLLQKRGLVRSTFKETLSMSNSIVFLFGVGDICLKYLQSIPYRMCHQLMREILYEDSTKNIGIMTR